jgi:ankyrin repeat protein
LTLPHGDPVAVGLTSAIQRGDLGLLGQLLAERPELATARMIGRRGPEGGWRTPLHVCADWPGYFPGAPEAVARLVDAGADPDAGSGGDRPETPLHWAASTDDVEVATALIDAGARLTTPGGSIGTPLANAIGYGCWHVADLLVARGAPVEAAWQAAALGMSDTLEELLGDAPTVDELSQAFWHACAGAQRRTAEDLLARGADLDWVPDYAKATPLDAAQGPGTRRENVITWLRERGARPLDG